MIEAKTIQKYRNRDLSWLKAKAVEKFNAWVRKRDRVDEYFTCISCNRTLFIQNYARGSNYHAGHFYPGTESALKFHEHNVNGQCDQCNTHKHGNQIEYEKGLVRKYGREVVDELHRIDAQYKRGGFHWNRIDLIDIIERYKSKK